MNINGKFIVNCYLNYNSWLLKFNISDIEFLDNHKKFNLH